MNIRKKYLIFLLLLSTFTVFLLLKHPGNTFMDVDNRPFRIGIHFSSGSLQETSTIWAETSATGSYLFLPAAAQNCDVKLLIEGTHEILWNREKIIRDGEQLRLIPGTYSIEIPGQQNITSTPPPLQF